MVTFVTFLLNVQQNNRFIFECSIKKKKEEDSYLSWLFQKSHKCKLRNCMKQKHIKKKTCKGDRKREFVSPQHFNSPGEREQTLQLFTQQ